ncbi:uncharacterized protein LOC141908893 [Tubulanus polymorphus]|uniref:uncharacterized protein LOC141908893 n=1 Tax=Tubulanus polymorphus TaxID=672921 RepID=UPI003DA1E372
MSASSDLSSQSSGTSQSSLAATFGGQSEERNFIKFAHLSNEFVRLLRILETFDAGALKETLLLRLQTKDPKLIVAMSTILPRQKFPADDAAHCVRCHKQFNPKLKSNCVLMHPNEKVVKVLSTDSEAIFMCEACNTKFKLPQMFFYDENVNSYYAGLCFQGQHTVNPADVLRQSAVRSCQDKGCIECYV